MKVFYEMAFEVNKDLNLNVDEQQDDTIDLKEQCDMDDYDGAQEITAARSPMKKLRMRVWHVIK